LAQAQRTALPMQRLVALPPQLQAAQMTAHRLL
jgi:hypothetical protein